MHHGGAPEARPELKRLLVAGATGSIGTQAVRQAKAGGWWVRSLARRASADTDESVRADVVTDDLAVACTGIDTVLSCIGAPVSLNACDKRSLFEVDTEGNRRLLEAAQRAGVGRFVYISMHLADGYRNTVYVEAHERFVEILRRSGMSFAIIRPTGVFRAMAEMLDFARKGMIPLPGGGTAKTNPIHEADVAAACVAALNDGPEEVSIGGPELFTRKQIAEEMFRAIGKAPRTVNMPIGVFRLIAKLQSIGSARKRELFEFFAAVATSDCVAPAVGRLRLRDYLANAARSISS